MVSSMYNLPVEYAKLKGGQKREVRELYIKQQNGMCLWCKQDLNGPPPTTVTNEWINWRLFPPNFLESPVHLQHNHDTGLTEGAVHARCNAVMWQYHGR
jgi:hypothetical protein